MRVEMLREVGLPRSSFVLKFGMRWSGGRGWGRGQSGLVRPLGVTVNGSCFVGGLVLSSHGRKYR